MRNLMVSGEDLALYASRHRQALLGQRDAQDAAGSLQQWLKATGKGAGIPYLKGQNLRGMDLSYADLSGVHFDGCTLQDAVLDQAVLDGAVLPKTCFKGVRASGTSFVGAAMQGCNFSEAKLLGGGPLAAAGLRKVTDFSGADLTRADFRHSHCRNIFFTAAQLQDSCFQGATLENTRFNHANMVGADLQGTQPQFRKAVGTRSHPVGIEMVGAIVVDVQGLDDYAGQLEPAITTVKQLTGAVERIAAMSQSQTLESVHQQMRARQQAASTIVERHHEGTSALTAALMELNSLHPVNNGFAERYGQSRSAGPERAR